MSTRTKLQIVLLTASVMMLLNVFSRPLGIPETAQWILMIGLFVPLGLLVGFIRQLKSERAAGVVERTPSRQNPRTALIAAWACGVACSLAAPLWLPITGVSVGTRGDLVIGAVTALVLSAIFAIRLKRTPNKSIQTNPLDHA